MGGAGGSGGLPPSNRNESFPGHSTLPVVAILASSPAVVPTNQLQSSRALDGNQSEAKACSTAEELQRRGGGNTVGPGNFQQLSTAVAADAAVASSTTAGQHMRPINVIDTVGPPKIDMMGPIRMKESLAPLNQVGSMANSEGPNWQAGRADSRKMKQNSRSRKFK